MNVKVITKFDHKEMEVKYNKFLNLRLEAIEIIKKHLETLRKDEYYNTLVKSLELGLSIIEGGYERYKAMGVDGLIAELEPYYRSPVGKELPVKGRKYRPILGLSRGFGEFLWKKDAWQREIMEAIHKIDDYYDVM
jgi:hypothetical protein